MLSIVDIAPETPDGLAGVLVTSAWRPIYAADGTLGAPAPGATLPIVVGASKQSSAARWVTKADAYATGYKLKTGVTPSVWNVALGCAVAQHETLCGDAWPGEHNWGACQRPDGRLTSAESAVLASAGIVPKPTNVAAARAAFAAAGLVRANAALHCDSSPKSGWYFVFFYAFDTDAEGAELFVDALAVARPACRAVLDRSVGAWASDSIALSGGMYASHYFEGFYVPSKVYPQKDGTTKTGAELNVAAYGGSIYSLAPGIFTALQGQAWSAQPANTPEFALGAVAGVKSALVFLANALKMPAINPGTVDNALNASYTAAVRAYQTYAKISADGVVGPQTRSALSSDLAKNGGAS